MNFEGTFFNTADYKLQKKILGEGTYGKVYIATNIHDQKRYAAKIFKTQGNFDGTHQMQLMRESVILQQLNHPSIIDFKGVNFQSFSDPEKLEPSIITEYLSNGSLRNELINEQRSLAHSNWTPTKKYITLIGIAHAMNYLHKNCIIHRDLKPENILMDENFYPKICDFGLSRCFPNSIKLTMTGQIGTPLYMSPELLNDERHYGPSVDVYAFSMIAYEIITGKVPFYELENSISPFAFAIKITNGYRPKWPKQIPEKMKKLISRCWSPNVEERPSFDEIFRKLSSDFSYFNEFVDEDEIEEYIKILKEEKPQFTKVNHDENDKLQKKIFHLKNKVKKVENHLNHYTTSSDEFVDALINLNDDISKFNPKEVIHFLKLSSVRGNSYASILLGILYAKGKGIKSDFSKSESYFETASKQGNLNGLRLLGFCYSNGYGVKIDNKKAFKYYQRACDLGDPRSMNAIARLYQNGFGVEKNCFKAFEFYKKSSDFGNAYAINNLGVMYCNGIGVKQDFQKAIPLFLKAAELGEPWGYYNLAKIYEKGQGVKQDKKKATELYKKASDLGVSI